PFAVKFTKNKYNHILANPIKSTVAQKNVKQAEKTTKKPKPTNNPATLGLLLPPREKPPQLN
ncbi:hypothetical protein ACNIQZ_25400, partial [Escherichia coli]